jgi:hypothetical protein
MRKYLLALLAALALMVGAYQVNTSDIRTITPQQRVLPDTTGFKLH